MKLFSQIKWLYAMILENYRLMVLHTKYRLHIMNSIDTIKYIKKNRCSVSRYGDGEFMLALGVKELAFQKKTELMSNALKNVLISPNDNLLICIPRSFNSLSGLKKSAKNWWIRIGITNNMQSRIVNLLKECCGKNYLFGDALITRPYMDMKSSKLAKRVFPLLKELWFDQDILIVEGEQTRLGVGNDLFDKCKTIGRILAPAIDAFDYYEDIKKAILDNYRGEMVLIALGPTATVLAADLAALNIWAIDIGHIDLEYEWFLAGAQKKTVIQGKYVNEVHEGRVFSECSDEKYLQQIIAHIGC